MKFELKGTDINCTVTKEELEGLFERFRTEEAVADYIFQKFCEWGGWPKHDTNSIYSCVGEGFKKATLKWVKKRRKLGV